MFIIKLKLRTESGLSIVHRKMRHFRHSSYRLRHRRNCDILIQSVTWLYRHYTETQNLRLVFNLILILFRTGLYYVFHWYFSCTRQEGVYSLTECHFGTTWNCVVSFTIQSIYSWWKAPVEQHSGWVLEHVWMFLRRDKSRAAVGIRTPYNLARGTIIIPPTLSRNFHAH